ncbi:MarR family transcriptional regulator [Nocardia implantans]|uniref:MarR family transcriptional regulator n=1 Tax=Nocardia implantans TaxID=3108168 RepID=A0ABU6AZJ8_9NOCA|nr:MULTISPECIES: MarR family transcriptional regulator [unclassified Nocardia]MBF6194106.1 MarR family transcriptional regulator [Nocardia beijingensis]MEA3529713.1 MarR family transcriptional regulator [Nocardia sp. CDC192]MEB3512809.1 MarR family transcriptional regulator [Nocardia sp. CDC186]
MSRESDLRELDAALRELSRAVHRAAERLTRVEPLTQAQAEVLRVIVHEPGTVPGRLAAVTGMQPSNVSTVLRHLTELGLIERETDPADRRSSRILPTSKAIENAARIDAARTQLVVDALSTVDEDEVDALLAAVPALRALASALHNSG